MANQWDPVVIGKKTDKPKTNEEALRAAAQQGVAIETVKKYNAGTNKAGGPANAAKLENETEELHVTRVSLSVSQKLQQARVAKGWTQKELATKINEKPQVVNEYESGKAIPSQQIMNKLERALGAKIRGKKNGIGV
ncbi:putative transcription factor Mbf1 [Planoprotostelium fungivorum]|uniref:Putative transcription factor Mbf1 n=1 Tax=Planoprotostelium fungivorum TaxID=1890364 RepID=A0A2P6NSK1_9EUKA|nr:putative transcription factor Mbf1 [Planoprotostelium fungivorum]